MFDRMQVTVAGVPAQLFGVEPYPTEVIVLGYHAPEDASGPIVIAGRTYNASLEAGLRAYGLPAPLDLLEPIVWEAT